MKKALLLVSALTLSTLVVGTAVAYQVPSPLSSMDWWQLPFTVVAPPSGPALAVVVALLALVLLAAVVMKAVQSRVPNRALAFRALIALAFGAAVGNAHASALTDGLGGAILGQVLPYLLTIGGAFAVTGLGFASKFIAGKANGIKNDNLRKALTLLDTLVFDKVTQIAQNAIGTLKAGAADGKLSPDEAKAAAVTAIGEVWASLPDIVKKLLSGIAGGDVAAQAAFIAPKVEVQVKNVSALSLGAAPISVPSVDAMNSARIRIGLGVPVSDRL